MNNHKIITTFLPKQVDIRNLDIVLPVLQKSNLIVHGEIHGIKENADIVYTLVKKLCIQKLAIEASPTVLNFINSVKINSYDFTGEFHVYDSFAGLPEKTSVDNSAAGEQFKAGELLAPRKTFVYNFKKAGLKLPIIHKGWFADFTPDDVPEDISFAFFDGDFYESIADSFRVCAGKFHKKATIIVDDYANEALPGVARAVDEWLSRNQQFVLRTEASLAIIYSCSKT